MRHLFSSLAITSLSCECLDYCVCKNWQTCVTFKNPVSVLRPVFRYFTPLGPRNFCPPPFVRIQLCSVKFPSTVNQFNNTCNSTRYQHCFQYRSPLNFSLVDSLFFRIPYFNLDFFNMPPLKICRLGPGPHA